MTEYNQPTDMTPEEAARIHLCTEMPVPSDRIIDAAIKAVEENPANAPLRDLPAGMGLSPRDPARMALITEYRWKPGRTLRIKFLDGASAVQDKVVRFARQWEEHANLKLDFVTDDDAEIRIAFTPGGSWSYLGTVALVIDVPQKTMNFGWLTETTSEDEYSRVVLHEFGHAFAAIHEHQHPEAGIPWDREKVYRYYQITQGWTREEVDRQVFGRYSTDITNFSTYDPLSIMHYSVPNELTEGDFEIGWNRILSPVDKEFIASMYPRTEAEEPELIPGRVLEAAIGKHGEEDRYRFSVDAFFGRRCTIETRGFTDVVMALYGPNDRTRLIASDDDSGKGYNARISRYLTRGDYFVRVRHYSSWATGSYAIRLAS